MERSGENVHLFTQSYESERRIEISLATKLGLSDLKAGNMVIRDERGWRQNEKYIDHVWIVYIARSFVGWCGIFSIKFNEHKFREHSNPEELVQGVFSLDNNGVTNIYSEISENKQDTIIDHFKLDLFNANKGIALDGISYRLRIISSNIDTFISVHNPTSSNWQKWENEIHSLGKQLASKSDIPEIIQVFK
ncbi:MAG: hypothetical protein Q8M29_19795 [Bacteroidota bacterium]|nr:hypothetical protein [Bacteroidota bacterium]